MRYWDYYIVLESDFLACRRYVEFSSANLGTYSVEFMHLLFAASTEAEIVLKQLCARLGEKDAATIVQWRSTLEPKLNLSSFRVQNIIMSIDMSPFSEWQTVNSPSWWLAYNGVKHNRSLKFENATLLNCVNALAGLFVANLYHEHEAFKGADLEPQSCLFKPILSSRPLISRQLGVVGYSLPNAHKLGAS